jgi:hypothetical protein
MSVPFNTFKVFSPPLEYVNQANGLVVIVAPNAQMFLQVHDEQSAKELQEEQRRFIEEAIQEKMDKDFERACKARKAAAEEKSCICAQGITKCPKHGEQPAQRGYCPKCGAVLGYCMEGEYCTKEDCNYAH